jgi:uncharacterized phage infection (PIP) family protein YhgE
MTDPVTNALAVQLEYGEDELKEQINERLRSVARSVADNVARDVASKLTKQMVEQYIMHEAAELVQETVARELKTIMDVQIRSALADYTNRTDYIQRHRTDIHNLAREAAQSINKDTLRAFTGSAIF